MTEDFNQEKAMAAQADLRKTDLVASATKESRIERSKGLTFALRFLAKNRNMSTMDIATKIGISKNTVGRWLRGASIPDALDLLPLSEILGVKPDLFVNLPARPEYELGEFVIDPIAPTMIIPNYARRTRKQNRNSNRT